MSKSLQLLRAMVYSNPKTKYRNFWRVLEFVDVHCHGVLILKKGSMEIDSSIEALDLTLQRGATFSTREEASSFSYLHSLENHAYCHTGHGLLSASSPKSQARHLRDANLIEREEGYWSLIHNIKPVEKINTCHYFMEKCSFSLVQVDVLYNLNRSSS